MAPFQLNNFLKAILFSNSEPLSIKDIQDLIAKHHQYATQADIEENTNPSEEDIPKNIPSLLTASQIRNTIEAINQHLENNQEVYRILETVKGFHVSIVPDYAYWVRLLRDDPKPLKLSQSLLETLTIIAYRQPITRAEIEAIRGVAVDGPIHKLSQIELIQVSGRAELPGRPMQYSTTLKFLEFCGIQSLDELPKSDLISNKQMDTWLEQKTYIHSEKDVGLPSSHSGTPLNLPLEETS